MQVAYLTNVYPKVSHTFIRREIEALEKQGCQVLRVSIRQSPDELVDPQDVADLQRTIVLTRLPKVDLAKRMVRAGLMGAGRLMRATNMAVTMGGRSDRGRITNLAYLAEAALLVDILHEHGIRHVHAHFGTNPAAIAMLAAAIDPNLTYSFTVHGPEEFDKVHSLHLAKKIQNAKFVVAISEYGRSQLMRQVRHSLWQKIHVVRCGLDASLLDWQVTPVPDVTTFACVGRLSEQKGHFILLDAVAKMKAQGHVVRVVFVGDGELRAAIEQRVLELGISNHIEITGWASEALVRTTLLKSRALVLPSFAEGLPVVIMEAFALSRPVISTRIAGIPELVTADCGWLVTASSTDELASAMLECLKTEVSALTKMAALGRSRTKRYHDVSVSAELLVKLFKA